MTAFKYNFAVVSRIPNSFRDLKGGSASVEGCRREHEEYVEVLRQLGIDVLELEAEERSSECVCVDDTAVIINGTALMCNPYGLHRQGEVNLIRQTLKRELGLKITELSEGNAHLEGGDVLFTGKEIFVGIGIHSNEAGAQSVARAFPEYPTTVVRLTQGSNPGASQLKQLVCMAGPNVIAVGQSAVAKQTLKAMMDVASYGYKIISLAEDNAANVLYANGSLVHLSADLIPKSFGTFENKIDYNRMPIDIRDLLAANCPISRLSLLVGKFKYQRKIVSTLA